MSSLSTVLNIPPNITPLVLTLGAHKEAKWKKYSVSMRVHIIERLLTVGYGSEGISKEEGYGIYREYDVLLWEVIGHKKSQLVVFCRGVVNTINYVL